MSKTITIDDLTAAELLNLLGYLSPSSRNDLQSQLAPPIVQPIIPQPLPTGSIYDYARVAGFTNCLVRVWDWSAEQHITIDTIALGGLGVNGILVVPFVPTGPADASPNVAMMSATGYPALNMGNQMTLCISETPCLLYEPDPASATDTTPTVTFGVGTVNRFWTGKTQDVPLVPGRQYYINVAGRNNVSASNPHGDSTVLQHLMNYPHADFRLEASKPQGH